MAEMSKLRTVAQLCPHDRTCLASDSHKRLRSVRVEGGFGEPPSLGKGRGSVTGQSGDNQRPLPDRWEMREADLTPAVSLGGVRGYYARASTRDSGQTPSQVGMIQIIPLMIAIGSGLVALICLLIFMMFK